MKYSIIIFLLILVFCNSTGLFAKEFGKEITLTNITKISDILDKPDIYKGKKVLIEGTIVDVCKKRGCWVDVSGDKEFQKMRVKVIDGVIVFPVSSVGKKIKVEGQVEKIVVDNHDHDGKQHDEGDSSCNHSKETYYRLKGLGAVIAD